MAICRDKTRNTYYISYTYKKDDGTRASKTIRNKERQITGKNKVSKRYLISIEKELIKEDFKKKQEKEHCGNINLKTLSELYLSNIKGRLKSTSVYNIELQIKKYILSFFNSNIKLDSSITLSSINKFNKYLSELDICAKTKNRLQKILINMLDFACSRDYLNYNYVKKINYLLTPFKDYIVDNEEINFWTNDEYDKFIKTFKDDDKWKLLFEVSYWGALRIAEVLGLTFDNINFSNKTISITKTLDRKSKITTTKTISSKATITLPTFLISELEKYKNEVQAKETDFVFFIHPTSRTTIRRIMDEHIKLSDVRKIKFHGLRHSMASRMINKGLNPLVVSKHLRHASTQQTLDTYAHLFPNITKNIMDNI